MRAPLFATMSLAWILAAPLPAQDPQTHLEVSDGWSQKAVTNGVLDARLRQAASQYREYAPVPRIALYDLTFARDSVEFALLNGFGVVVVTSVAQDSAELPLRRAYLRAAGRDVELRRIAVLLSTIDTSLATVRATFGTYRMDALYLVPVAPLLAADAELFIDFAVRRSGFRIGTLARDALPSVVRSFRPPTEAVPPPPAALRALISREFPGLPDGLVLPAVEP